MKDLYALTGTLKSGRFKIGVNHDFYKLLEGNLRRPTQLTLRLRCVGSEGFDFRRAEINRVNLHVFLPIQVHIRKRHIHEFPDGMDLPGADNVIIRLILLKHEPHGFDIIRSIAPIPFGIEVAEIKLLFLASEDARQAVGNLSRDERFPTAGGLVVEENSVAGEKAVALAVISDHPVGVDFGGAVGAAGVEGRRFILGRRRGAEHLAARSLVKAGFDAAPAEGLEEARRPQGGDISRVFGEVEAHADVALGAEMVDLIGPEVVGEIGHLLGIGQVPIMEKEPDIRQVRVLIEMIDPAPVEAAGAADEAVDLVALMKKKFGKIGAILARNSCD